MKKSKKVDNYIIEENVNFHFEYIYQPKKVESHLTNYIVNDVELYNTDRARPYVFCFYRLSKLAVRYNRDLRPDEIQKCKKDTFAIDGDNNVEKALDFCLKIKGEERKGKKNKIFNCILQLLHHSGSQFDTWIILNNFPCDKGLLI